MFSINESVTGYVDELLSREEELNVKSYYLENQSAVIDCGVQAAGSIGAGVLATTIGMGGLGRIALGPGIIDGYYLQFAQVWVDRPAIACLCSQMPGWKIKTDDFSGMAFGPARAIVQKPKDVFAAVDYADDSEMAVVLLWSSKLPGAKETELIAKQCSTDPECVVAIVARHNSIAGSVINSARAIEWAMSRLFQLGYDVRAIDSASSAVPVAPITADSEGHAIAAMDSIAYYGMVSLYTSATSDVFRKATADSSRAYGKSFRALLKDAQGDLSRVDPAIFAPARLMVNGRDGTLKAYGRLDPAMLMTTFGLKS
ncbi:MAG TPA: methenyltetrahydromethanopterin cyclohydrolase [Methanocella sp.]|nr:methenyltetrahydromethanopterin cyclohydrolase [Methanocella sp.]